MYFPFPNKTKSDSGSILRRRQLNKEGSIELATNGGLQIAFIESYLLSCRTTAAKEQGFALCRPFPFLIRQLPISAIKIFITAPGKN